MGKQDSALGDVDFLLSRISVFLGVLGILVDVGSGSASAFYKTGLLFFFFITMTVAVTALLVSDCSLDVLGALSDILVDFVMLCNSFQLVICNNLFS